jgi:hypothetical protein
MTTSPTDNSYAVPGSKADHANRGLKHKPGTKIGGHGLDPQGGPEKVLKNHKVEVSGDRKPK